MSIKEYSQYLVTDTEAELLALSPMPGTIGWPMDSKVRVLYDGTSWKPSAAIQILRGTVEINGKATGNTKIFTTPNTSFKFVPIGIHVEYTDITGVLGLAPNITIGTNPTTYNNIASSNALATLLSSVGLVSPSAFTIANAIPPIVKNTDIYARVTTAATLYTAYKLRADIFGYY